MLAEARDQFKSGVPLFSKEGAFHRVLEDFLNAALEGEMDGHLQETKPMTKNRRNGKMPKRVQTEYGPVEIETPRDRDGSFTPEIVQKRQTVLAEGLSDKIISLYATGQSMADIQAFLEENYGTEVSRETISNITEKVWPEIKSWRDKWDNLSRYFQYTEPIRRIIYTTNIVEGYHRQVRKVTKTKGVFPSDDALYKLVYLVYRNIRKKWTQPHQNWGQTAQQLAIKFGDRFRII